MYIDGHHKLILYPKISVSLLYDLKNDPLELVDLSSKDGSYHQKRNLFRGLLSWQQRTGDEVDLESAFPELAAE